MDDKFRQKLHRLLHDICDTVYFNEPDKVEMDYPCIIYQRKMVSSKFAGNMTFSLFQTYQVTYLDRRDRPDIIEKILTTLPGANHTNEYINDGVHHSVFDVNVHL